MSRIPTLLSVLFVLVPLAGASAQSSTVRVIVELDGLPPAAVAEHEAKAAGVPFAREAHQGDVLASQIDFLRLLELEGIEYRMTESPLQLPGRELKKPHHFTLLINAVGLQVRPEGVDRIRRLPGVKKVTPEEPITFGLDNSVSYVRASDGPGNKTIFSQAGGPLERFDGEGQVIAILDTGIDPTHPTFDTRFDDVDFAMRTGDTRPVRTAGQAFDPATHHPKVVYFLSLTATTNQDDVGHGTHCGADSAGLMVEGPGLDRIPGNADDQLIEGIAPRALLMNYKVCETTFTCVGTVNIITALEDALSPTDPVGNPKPIATVVNMSFGGGDGDPTAPSSVASDNAALLGAVMVSSAGNSGPGERTLGAPSAARRVISVGASKDPGAFSNETDVLLPDAARYGSGASTGGQDDTGRPTAPQDIDITTIIMAGAPDVTFPLGQHYVYTGFADTADQVPNEVLGRIALASRGSTVDGGAAGTGTFANKVAQVTAKGAIALLIFNNVDGELEAATAAASTIPVYGISKANGEYLRDVLGFQDLLFDPDNSLTWGTLSNFPVRINPPDPATFEPNTTGFSSRGPIEFNQYVKPDITAPGENIYAATIPAGGASTGGGTMSDPSRYISVSGTSFSGPQVAGAAALVRQAMLEFYGETPIPDADLMSGAGAILQQSQNELVPQSVVRAMLQNSATNLRVADNVTPVANSDDRTFVHEIGSGLLHVIEAVDARAALGTNEANGFGGPDSAHDVDFLPTFSFGENEAISTNEPSQVQTVTVTLENLMGASGAGTYSLSLIDGGGLRGDVTRPISGTLGFSLSLSATSVALGSAVGDQATFDVTVDVDGRPAPLGLAPAGLDVNGQLATEFLWWVVATGTNGEVLRMPFSYRAVLQAPDPKRVAPFLNAIADDDVPDQRPDGSDRDGSYELSWTYPTENVEPVCGFVVERATRVSAFFSDDAEEVLVGGENSTWTGDPNWVSAPHPDTTTNAYHPLYTDEQDLRLTTLNPITLPTGRTTLIFQSWEDIETDFDYGQVEVSADDGPFIPVAIYTGIFTGLRNVDLSGFGGQDVRIRFRFLTDQLVSAPVHLGWFIDDVRLESSNFGTIATLDASTFSFSVEARNDLLHTRERTIYYRVGGLFGNPCDLNGPFSSYRTITVRPQTQLRMR